MRLEIDAGNTFIKWRILEADKVRFSGRVLTASTLNGLFSDVSVELSQGAYIGSVASKAVNEKLRTGIKRVFGVEPVFVKTERKAAGITNSYDDPERMGVDRWLAMVAAANQVNHSPVVVVDCGSAITVDYVSINGEHEGGYILPGLNLMKRSLLQGTANVDFTADEDRETLRRGKSTREAVENGAEYLFASLAEKLRREAEAEHRVLIFTGGDGALLQELADTGVNKPDLVLDGLAWCAGYA